MLNKLDIDEKLLFKVKLWWHEKYQEEITMQILGGKYIHFYSREGNQTGFIDLEKNTFGEMYSFYERKYVGNINTL